MIVRCVAVQKNCQRHHQHQKYDETGNIRPFDLPERGCLNEHGLVSHQIEDWTGIDFADVMSSTSEERAPQHIQRGREEEKEG